MLRVEDGTCEMDAALPELVDRGSLGGVGEPDFGRECQIQDARTAVEAGPKGPGAAASTHRYLPVKATVIGQLGGKEEVADQNQLLGRGEGPQAGLGRGLRPGGLVGQPELKADGGDQNREQDQSQQKKEDSFDPSHQHQTPFVAHGRLIGA